MPVYLLIPELLKQPLHTVDYFSEIAPNVARISVIRVSDSSQCQRPH
jgi:hypothetical protein